MKQLPMNQISMPEMKYLKMLVIVATSSSTGFFLLKNSLQ